jgi:hypothetical protein
MVVLFTCVDLQLSLNQKTRELDDASFGIGLGVVSTIVGGFFILVHYRFFSKAEEGEWLELSSSFFLILLWTIGLAVMTQNEGIAATLSGSQGDSRLQQVANEPDCVLTYLKPLQNGTLVEIQAMCLDLVDKSPVPGSNLYFFSWICFFSSLNVTFRWKAAQALQFAHAAQQQEQQQQYSSSRNGDTSERFDTNNNGDDGADDNESDSL